MAEIDPERLRGTRREALLDVLEEIPENKREAYLQRHCLDPELRREILAMLAAESEGGAYIDRFAEELVPRPSQPPDLTGRRVGAYRLLRPVGRGGMGVVYEAERADGAFEQRVALKLLTTALTGTEAHERFLAERRILAGLEHPTIARIVDGGVTEDGTPWFAMEHVRGEPIDAYCDRQRLSIRERLELFLQVCDAVEHAHRRLVVHRDLKPANVLVTEDREVKLLDFGIAKLLGAEVGPRAGPHTRTALRLMTPEYASPEQVRGESVTTASDVYQLGLLLYELLTGHRPYVLRNRGSGELERAICEQPPTRPSTTLSREVMAKRVYGASGSTIKAICQARCSSPARLRRRLRGDLENIALKALRKEPDRRYGSADRLAQDIRRHLAELPITARPDTWVYRGRKFLQRHALGSTVTAAVLVLAVGVTGFHTTRIQRARDRAEAERDRAQAEAAKSEQVSEFLTALFASADPRRARGSELTARELLDRGVERLDRELAGQPETQASMLHILGRTYSELGLYDAADRLLTRALELRRRDNLDRTELAKTLIEIGNLRFRQDRYEDARQYLEEATAFLEALAGERSRDLASALDSLGATYWRLGEHEKGLAAFRRTVAIQRRAHGEGSVSVATALRNLGGAYIELGDLERAEGVVERFLAIYRRQLGSDHPHVGTALTQLANVKSHQGEYEAAEALYRDALEVRRRAYGPAHPHTGMALNNLGSCLSEMGRLDEAIEVLQQAVGVFQTAGAARARDAAFPLVTLGDTYRAAGRPRDARNKYRQGVAVLEAIFGTRRFDRLLAYSLVGLADLEVELGDRVAADRILSRATEVWSRAPATIGPELVTPLLDLSRWLVEQRRCPEAVPLLHRALQGRTAEHASSGSNVAELESLLAACS